MSQKKNSKSATKPAKSAAPADQAIDTIAKSERIGNPKIHDVIIVGGGPAGLAASLAAKQHGLRALTLEQDALGGTVARYPRGKIVMTRPAELPLYGRLKLRRVRKEKLLALWHDVIGKTGVQIHHGVRVHRVTPRNWAPDPLFKVELYVCFQG